MIKITNKQRILRVMEILFKETDEKHELSLEDILDKLKLSYGSDYDVTFRSIKDDIAILRNCEFNIDSRTVEHGKKMYSYQDRLFETNELRILIDSISSSGSIGVHHKNRIIDKIKKLTSKNIEINLSNQVHIDYKSINEDRTFRYNLDKIHEAIQYKNKIEFEYGRYNINKEFIINKKSYKADPYNLVWDNGFYYLVAYDEVKEKIINFRVDRIRSVKNLKENYVRDILFNLKNHLEACFNMYPGKIRLIKVKFHNHLINAIIDRFGVGIKVVIEDDDHFTLITRAAINTGLIRWILNWGSDAEVISPQSLIDDIKLEIRKMNEIYNGE